jgi:chromosome segregation ATPase
MRNTIWLMVLALAAGGACKKTESEKAATEVRKAQEAVENKREDVREEANDVATAKRELGKEVTAEARDVVREGKQLTDAERKLERARGQLQAVVKGRLASVDGQLASLDSRTDPVSKQLATDLRARRDVVSNRLAAVDSIAITNWDAYEKDVEDNLKVLENDLDKALDTTQKPVKPAEPIAPMK